MPSSTPQCPLYCWFRLHDISASRVRREYHKDTDEEYRQFTVKMAEDSITYFIDQTVAARAALADLSRYVPEVRDWITSGWKLTEEREPEQRRLVEQRRAPALKTERLLRQSKAPSRPPSTDA